MLNERYGRRDFDALLARVRAVDAEAAEKLGAMEPGGPERFRRKGKLCECFTWGITAEGFNYWFRIFIRIGEAW